jgi:DNA-binding IclR family transcriptional regulator
LHISLRIGSVLSNFDTATGRAFASVIAKDKLAQAVAAPLGELLRRQEFKKRFVDLEKIKEEAREHGLSRIEGGPIPSVNAFSAPVFDFEGNPVLVVTVTDNQDRLKSSWNSHMVALIKNAVAQISESIGESKAKELD